MPCTSFLELSFWLLWPPIKAAVDLLMGRVLEETARSQYENCPKGFCQRLYEGLHRSFSGTLEVCDTIALLGMRDHDIGS